ncbi:hypothetical protein CJD36_007020 [Flavipsychrobacter stenotrophus]|uniref:MCBG-like protein n=1 Tax=Flavipsychrobacter stenotrophus TaxID=2077091 RepID=A0A2S7SY82_9BACT|nr:pentapeptide repeat-containing protein [Flavipsychrobacter stenotrophus]PQJ11545.1 hypothetical protein CJD36_007020 [Flavipsychrobacter stenotrophus]
MNNYIEGATIENTDFTEQSLAGNEYTNCEFINCNFTNCDLKNTDLIECTFKGCNFSQAILNNTGIKGVQFTSCKLIGINFQVCSDFLFSIQFADCQLDYASFFQKKMKKTLFSCCSIKEADFEETDLTEAVFTNCDLLHTSFNKTILEKADLRTAYNYSLDPELNRIKKAKFSHHGISGLLSKYDIVID